MRRMRTMIDKYSGDRVLIGETYLPDTVELNKWYGGSSRNELQLPMDLLIGFAQNPRAQHKLDATWFRKYIEEAETELNGSQPLIVFDNHDNERSIDRFGDGTHDVAMAKIVATMLLTTKATALTYYGAELGMPTTTPTRREDVKDPIGVTGWPKEKGRDGERTPMQWTPGPQSGFSTNPNTWLPIPPSYKTINVETESADPGSLLNWHKQLIELRRKNPALHNGGFVMLNKDDKNVLSYVRTAPKGSFPVVVAMNMSAAPQTVSLDLAGAGITATKIKTLAATDPALQPVTSTQSITLPPYGSWVAILQ
jgi:alpha-glucosidase